jgi:hypothetical protein
MLAIESDEKVVTHSPLIVDDVSLAIKAVLLKQIRARAPLGEASFGVAV